MGESMKHPASGAVDSGLILSRVKLMTLILVFTAHLLDVGIKGTWWIKSPQVDLLCSWKKHLRNFPS